MKLKINKRGVKMNRKITKFISGGIAAILSAVSLGGTALAWGPADRPTYTMAAPADHATFNSITDNSWLGDERSFIRIVEKGSNNDYSTSLTIQPDKEYSVYIYYHNDASATYNDRAHNYVGVATDVRMSSSFSQTLAAGEPGTVNGMISWTTLADRDTTQKVWDELKITATDDMTLHYVAGSAKIYNSGSTNGRVLSMDLFSEQGTYLGYDDLNGILPGCDEFSGHVDYTIQTKGSDTPPTPTTPENPGTPSALPNTGPAEVFLAVALILVIVAGFVYFSKTHKAVKKATRSARGRAGRSTKSAKNRKK